LDVIFGQYPYATTGAASAGIGLRKAVRRIEENKQHGTTIYR
jgi:hypothetical protein